MAATFPSVVTVASVSRERTEGVCQRPGRDAKEGLPPPAPRTPLHRSGSVARRAGHPEPPKALQWHRGHTSEKKYCF